MPKLFLWQWIVATAVGYGLTAGFGNIKHDEPAIALSFTMIAFSGLLVGLFQWIVLNQVIQGASLWIGGGWLIWAVGLVIALQLVMILPIITGLWIVLSYPLLISVNQWLVLRRYVKPSWWWILVNSLAITVGISILIGAVAAGAALGQSLTVAGAIGGLLGGAIQGGISGLGLRLLLQRRTQSNLGAKGREKPPTPQSGLRFLMTSLLFLCMGGWSILVFHMIKPAEISGTAFLVLLFVFFVYSYISILIHELGHLVGALVSGFKLNFLTVARFILIREQHGLKLRRMRKMSAGGLTSTVPMSHHNLKKKLMVFIAGGPIASFALFLLGLCLLPFPNMVGQNPLLFAVVLFAGLNLYLAITNSLPLKVGFYTTDGYIMSSLARNTVEGQRFLAMYEYLVDTAQGVRPRELSDELVARSLAHPEKSMHHGYGLIMAYYKALDSGDVDQAGKFLDEALAIKNYIPEFIRASLFMEAAYFEAHHRQSADNAQEWFNQVEEFVFLQPYTQRRVEAALALAHGHHQKSLEECQKGIEAIYVDSLRKGMAIAEQDWLNQILAQSTSR